MYAFELALLLPFLIPFSIHIRRTIGVHQLETKVLGEAVNLTAEGNKGGLNININSGDKRRSVAIVSLS